ncbi:MAG: endonuclease/exonuclease/phosphatase family protein [Romboutsia sp.]|uniref:endonuclease/exonuclease/phosphatase family protein n=1 Tax=Romboutsia sp. TaxID=1965302 RepID=UPI003F30782D
MKIVTYNIHKGMDSSDKFTLNKISKYLKELDCDVICLQEVLYPQFAKLKMDLKMDGVFAANINKVNMMYGICTFSKTEIDNHTHVLLTSKKEQRGFLYTNIFSQIGKFNVINTHLGLDSEERKQQLSEIIDYTHTLVGRNIICGDFNEKNININTFYDMAVFENNYDLCTFKKTSSRIDYIFVDTMINIDSYDVNLIKYSDHYPVIGQLR